MQTNVFKGYSAVVAAAVMWASSGTAGKALFAEGITPFELVQIRVTLSALILGAILGTRSTGLFRIRVVDVFYFLLLGGFVMSLLQVTYFYAISKIHVAAAIFLQYLSPVIVAFFAICFWREPLNVGKILSLILSVTGCYLVVGGYSLELMRMNRIGILTGLASAMCFAVYTLFGERGMHRYSPWTVIFYAFLFSSIAWHTIYPPFKYVSAGYSLEQWGLLLYISVIGTLLPFGLFFVGVNHIRSTRAAITATLEPISAGFMAYFFLDESLEPLQVLGGALVVCAIVLLQLRREQDRLAPAVIRDHAARE